MSPSVIWISRGLDQAQLGQDTIPVVIVIRSISARLSMCSHFGQMCTLSQCLRSRGFGLWELIKAPATQQRKVPFFLTEKPLFYSSNFAKQWMFFGSQDDKEKTSRRNNMPETQKTFPSLPPDDLNRTLTSSNPDHEGKFPHISLVGDTYTKPFESEK